MGFSEAELQRLKDNLGIVAIPVKGRARKSAAVMSERKLEQTCTQMLEHDGWRSLKTDPVSDRKRGKGFVELGMADYLYLRYNKKVVAHRLGGNWYDMEANGVLWIEWKRMGGKADPHQLTWHAKERERGALVLLAGVDFPATPEGFWDWYCNSGLKRQ